jgi:23S rRNA pseudouridine1911/1915/1917 synthase
VFGDPDYGGRVRALGRLPPGERETARALLRALPGPALHASELSFRHPVSGETVRVRAEAPPDFENLLEALGRLDAQ